MKKLTTILIMILLLFNIQVSAENYESIIITKPEGTFGQYVPKADEMYPSYGDTLPVGTRLTEVKTEEPFGGFDCVSGFTSNGKQYIVFRKDTSLEDNYPPVDEEQIILVNTPESIIVTNPEGAIGFDPYIDDGVAYDVLPVGTRLTEVKMEEPIGEDQCVSGVTYDGKQYKVFRKDTSLENIYPPVDETQINLANTPDKPPIWPWIVLGIVLFSGLGILSVYLTQPQCPKCKSRGSREVKRQFLNSESVLFKEEERIKEYDNKGRGRSNTAHKAASNQYVNPPTKIIVKEKLVEGTREYYNVTYQCNKCGEQYIRKEHVDRKPKIV